MKNYTYEQLTTSGYSIKNALIINVDLSMADHGCFTLAMTLEGGDWGRRVWWLLPWQRLSRRR